MNSRLDLVVSCGDMVTDTSGTVRHWREQGTLNMTCNRIPETDHLDPAETANQPEKETLWLVRTL